MFSETESPFDLLFFQNELYVSSTDENLISKIDLTPKEEIIIEDKNKISVYPNPSIDYISINNLTTDTFIRISDMQGKIIKEQTVNSATQIPISRLKPGYYLIIIEGTDTLRFIKK